MTTTFETPQKMIKDLLDNVAIGKIQLPDFQREWVWDDQHVRKLIASISLSYPIGSIMLLQLGGDIRLKSRPLSGVQGSPSILPAEFLILDGQQRITALFQSTFSDQPVDTKNAKGKSVKRWYYLNITDCLDSSRDREDAVISMPEDHINKDFRGGTIADYSTLDKQYEAQVFPVNILFDQEKFNNWQMGYMQYGGNLRERVSTWNEFMKTIITPMQTYLVSLIQLTKETKKEAVCQVFERVNTGGIALTVFELLTASFNLRDDWKNRFKVLEEHKVLSQLKGTEFLQVVSLISSWIKKNQQNANKSSPGPVSCRGKDMLRLEAQDYKNFADKASDGFLRAARFMHGQSIFHHRDLPYKSQLIPLAAILTLLGDEAANDGIKRKISQWYWCGVFGELYGGSVDSKVARDVVEVIDWVKTKGTEPSAISEAIFKTGRLRTLHSRTSTPYKGIYALLMHRGALDFRTGEPFEVRHKFGEKTDIHHIFPKKWCKDNKLNENLYDCILNKTPITAQTNKIIGSKPPSKYIKELQEKASIMPERMQTILDSHLINIDQFIADDFRSIIEEREAKLLKLIGELMGKEPFRDSVRDDETEDGVIEEEHNDEANDENREEQDE